MIVTFPQRGIGGVGFGLMVKLDTECEPESASPSVLLDSPN